MKKIPPSGSWAGAKIRRILLALFATLLASMAFAGTASALTFSPPVNYPAGNNPLQVITADFNGDGHADLASANAISNTITVLLGDGTGNFAAPLNFGAGNTVFSIAAADFNGDGKLDIAAAISTAEVSVLLGDGTGNFGPANNFAAGLQPRSVVTGDFDSDGNVDLITANSGSDDLSVIYGDGNGGFAPPQAIPVGTNPQQVITGDFDGDGHTDLASANFNSNDVSVIKGSGFGGFAPAVNYPVAGSPSGLATGDLDGDGDADLVTANIYSGNLSILTGDGSGHFNPGPTVPAFGSPASVTIADLNGDGNPDLIVPDASSANVAVHLGNSSGGFGPPTPYPVGGNSPRSAVSADFNEDGFPDLASANSSVHANNISVLLNQPKADVSITKTALPGNPGPGDIVTYTLKAKNLGNITANGVLITDSLPVGMSFVSADAPCTHSQGTLTCAINPLAPGDEVTLEVKATVDGWGTANPGPGHLIDVQRVEAQVDLDAGQQRTVSVGCPGGFFVADGSVRIDHIDQGGGDWPDPQVLESRATSAGTWQGTVRNTATGRAQAKIFGVCVRQQTGDEAGHHHGLVITDPISVTDSVGAGSHAKVLQCGPGQVAIQPGFISSSPGDLVYSQPEGNGWKFILGLHSPSHVTYSIRCLTRDVGLVSGHTHGLGLERIGTEVEIPAGKVSEIQLTCADGSKGIVAGWDLDHGLLSLGNDPRPVTRAFKFYNPTNLPLHARLTLLCLGDRTGSERLGPADLINTAYISTSSDEVVIDNNISSATVSGGGSVPTPPAIDPDPPVKPVGSGIVNEKIESTGDSFLPFGGNTVSFTLTCKSACSGVAKVVTTQVVKVKGKKFRKGMILAKGRFSLGRAGSSRVKMKLTVRGRLIIKSGKTRRMGLLTTSGGISHRVRIAHP